MNATLSLILLSVAINTLAQVLLKEGMNQIGYISLSGNTALLQTIVKIALNPFIVSGLFSYVASVGVWLIVLSRTEVSYAYPLVSLGYIATAIAGYFLFNEAITITRVAGILIIIAGVFIVTRS